MPLDKSKIKKLNLAFKNLNQFPDLHEYTNLEELDISGNKFTTLGFLPPTIQKLVCAFCDLE